MSTTEETGSDILDIDVADLEEPEVLPEGTEVVLICKQLKSKFMGKADKAQWPVIFGVYRIEDQPGTPAIMHNEFLPSKELMDAERYADTMQAMKKFLAAHDLPLRQPDLSEAAGTRIAVILKVDDYNGEESNKIKRILGPA